MIKEVITQIRLCDVCEEAGKTVVVLIHRDDSSKAMAVELCSKHDEDETLIQHAKKFGREVTDFAVAFKPVGTPVKAVKAAQVVPPALEPAKVPVPRTEVEALDRSKVQTVCGDCQAPGVAIARGAHADKQHGKKAWEIKWTFVDESLDVVTCGCGYPMLNSTRNDVVGQHQRRSKCPAWEYANSLPKG